MNDHHRKPRQLTTSVGLLALMLLILLAHASPTRAGSDDEDQGWWHNSKSPKSSPSSSPSCMTKQSESPSPPMSTCPPKKSESPSPVPSESASPSASPSASASPVPSESASPSASASPVPSESASPSASPSPPESASPSPSASVPASPSASPSASSPAKPSHSPTPTMMCPPKPSRSPSPKLTTKRPPKHCTCECACPSASPSSAPKCGCPSSTPEASPSPSTSSCPPNNARLGQAADFSAFVLGNSSAVGPSLDMVNGDFESAAAVRGGLRLRSFGVNQAVSGAACTDGESQRFTLIAEGGTIDYSNGQLFCGNLLASADAEILSAPSFGGGSVQVGDVTELSGIDFDEALRELLDESETLCSAVEDGEATDAEVDSSGGITLTATGAPIETFSVRARDLSAATGVRFVGFEGQSTNEVIISVMREADDSEASLVLSNFAVDLGSVPARSVLWNICGGTDLVVIQAVGLPGALLAAGADVTLQNGQVTGQVVARTMRGSGGGQIINPPC